MGFPPLKLHTRTTILISSVLVIVLLVVAYFSDLAITNLSDQQERQQAQLLATRIADTVEHHIKRETRREKSKDPERPPEEAATIPDWAEVQEEIAETIAKTNPQLAEVRVFHKTGPDKWEEAIRLPADAGDRSLLEQKDATQQIESSKVVAVREQGQSRSIIAIAPVISTLDSRGLTQIATVSALLNFDENQSYVAELRSLIWPLMLLAIVAITLITYFLFRHIIYRPIDRLLLAMAKAEKGNLAAEVEQATPDEIGMLTLQFNRMLSRIREMTGQLNLEQRKLEDRVREATREIAERKEQLEEANLRLFEMQRQMTQLERLAAAGQLAAQFAHEVGTPLNLISGHVQLLRARTSDERVTMRLDVIAGQIERITNIVRAMLDSTRRPGPRFEATDVNSLLTQILDAAQPTLAVRNVEVRINLADELPRVPADADQIQQVFINLINNSLDAMPRGGELFVCTRRDQDWAVIEVSDTGEGIAEDKLDLIFEPLFSTKKGRGTGLGLTVVKQIVSEHHGEIETESQPGRGTTFRIKLLVGNIKSDCFAPLDPAEAGASQPLESTEQEISQPMVKGSI